MAISRPLYEIQLAHTYGGVAWAKPKAWWVQLHTGPPGDYCVQQAWTQAGRKACNSWSVPAELVVTNLAPIKWTKLPQEVQRVNWVSIWTAETNGMPMEWLPLAKTIETQPGGVLELGPGAIQIGTREPEDLGDVAGVVEVGLTQTEIVRLRITDSVVLELGAPGWPAERLLVIEQGGAGGHQVVWPELSGSRPLVSLEPGSVTVVWLVWDGRSWHVLN